MTKRPASSHRAFSALSSLLLSLVDGKLFVILVV